MKTAIIITGNITKQNGTILYNLYNITAGCKIRVVDIILIPNYPVPAHKKDKINYMRAARHFSLSSNLVTRGAYNYGNLIIEKTPLCIFLKFISRSERFMVENFDQDYYNITNATNCGEFTFTELKPTLKPGKKKDGTEKDINITNYYFNVIIHLAIEIPDV